TVKDADGRCKDMLMFGSNNYLGFANHPYIKQQVKRAIDKYGVGVAGPPLLNGYTSLMQELEERLSHLKGTESTLIYSSGYNANLGLVTGLCTAKDILIADEYCHASFFDGVQMLKSKCYVFKHNRIDQLKSLLQEHSANCDGTIFVATEGIFSMDGDVAPLNEIIPIVKKYNATLLLDDAHATAVIGSQLGGSHDFFKIPVHDDIILGTMSKAFGVNGGFISGPKPVIDYLRLLSRSYMFSAALPTMTLASVLAGLDILENEPYCVDQLHDNVRYVTRKLERFGLAAEPKGGIIALMVPTHADIRLLARDYHDAGIFLNAIEYPAVPFSKQRFRISCMATHTREDLDRLIAVTEEIWYKYVYKG
ncbi:MAG: aminotransferase class I/II-fold pyridoxal phosphate-dependent enzyme, partial [Bacteroidales bacterium]|nr:aminotransferase class I/II-fold pyridoxal phosphate-dependent enzyme [Bacteroidales bacterium]